MEISKETHTRIFIEKLINDNNDFGTSLILLRDENKTTVLPLAIKTNSYKYLKNISNDKAHQEKFLCDIVYELEKPEKIVVNLVNYSIESFYINKNKEKKNLNIIELLSLAIRYSIEIYIENILIFLKTEEYISVDENKKVDLYRLDQVQFDRSEH